MMRTRKGRTTLPKKTIYCPAAPDLYATLDRLRRAKMRQTGQRVTLNAVVLELVLTHPTILAMLPPPLPAD